MRAVMSFAVFLVFGQQLSCDELPKAKGTAPPQMRSIFLTVCRGQGLKGKLALFSLNPVN